MKTPTPESKRKEENEFLVGIRTKIQGFPLIVFAGLVKNAGKTTALNALSPLFPAAKLGLTSIGYDGEEKDIVYNHPKPPVRVLPGQLVLTAERFLPQGKQGYDLVESWGGHSQFGAWQILKITEKGSFRMAGPANLLELREGISRLRHHGAQRIFIDGALNRMSQISLSDAGVVLSTGAALGNDLGQVVERTRFVLELFRLPVSPGPLPPLGCNSLLRGGTWNNLPKFLWQQDLTGLLPIRPEALYLAGAFTDKLYLALVQSGRIPQSIVVDNPAHVLLSPAVWSGLNSRGVKLSLRNRPHLLLITLNPWHPLTPLDTGKMAESLLPFSYVPLVDIDKQKMYLSRALHGGDTFDPTVPS